MRRRVTAIVISICLLLTACGQTGQNGTGQKKEGDYSANISYDSTDTTAETNSQEEELQLLEKAIPDAEEALLDYLPENGSGKELWWDMAGDTIYRFVRLLAAEGWTEGYCLQKLASPYTEWVCETVGITDFIEGQQCYVEQAVLQENGDIQLLILCGDIYYWTSWEQAGSQDNPPTQITGSCLNDDLINGRGDRWYIDENRISYLYLNSQFCYYDADFTEVQYGSGSMQGSFYQVTQYGDKKYVCGNSLSNQFTIWDIESGEAVYASSEFGLMESQGRVIFTSSTDAYMCNTMTVVHISLEDGSWEFMPSLLNEGYSGEPICGGISSDGNLLLLVRTGGKICLLEMSQNLPESTKTKLEFAINYASPYLKELVVAFNKQNSEYEVKLRTPGNEDWSDFENKILTEMGSGAGPDMVDSHLIDVEDGVRRGYLKDMTEWYQQNQEKVMKSVWDTGMLDEKVFVIPYCCRLWTLVCNDELLGKQHTWNLEELQQCLRDLDCQEILTGINMGDLQGGDVFYYLGIFPQSDNSFIDWNNRQSHLDSPEAIELLKFIKEHQKQKAPEEAGSRVASGEIPLLIVNISGIDSLQMVSALYQDQEKYIGFPVNQGEVGNFIDSEGIMVNQASEQDEGISQFLSYLISESAQKDIAKKACEEMAGIGLPVSREAMDLFVQKALDGEYVDPYAPGLINVAGYEYENMVLTKDSMDKFCQAFDSAEPMPNLGMVYSITTEEAQAYFTGNKSAENVATAMQNRVQLYLDEMR